jgi:[ribosomal protein S5]-alanine N-acetyltransferase
LMRGNLMMVHDIDTFYTARLVAERVRPVDYDELCRMHRDPVTMATLGGVRSDEVTRKFVDEKLAHWEAHGHGTWMFRGRQDLSFVGRGLLEYIEVGGNEELEVGYSVIAGLWGKGFATEMATAIVAIAFTRLDRGSIVSFTWPDNLASRRVMEKAGFTFERDIVHVGRPHVLYRMRREDFGGQPELRWADGVLVIE